MGPSFVMATRVPISRVVPIFTTRNIPLHSAIPVRGTAVKHNRLWFVGTDKHNI